MEQHVAYVNRVSTSMLSLPKIGFYEVPLGTAIHLKTLLQALKEHIHTHIEELKELLMNIERIEQMRPAAGPEASGDAVLREFYRRYDEYTSRLAKEKFEETYVYREYPLVGDICELAALKQEHKTVKIQ